MLHKEILTEGQVALLPAIGNFREDFGLVGGTALALQIGHRESVDFDLFTKDPAYVFDTALLKRRFARYALIEAGVREREEELTFRTKTGVQVTFFRFEYRIPFTEPLERIIQMPDVLALAAMKAYALGYRAKWKDYVDLYFIMRDRHSLKDIARRARELFGGHFNERLFRQQMSHFGEMNYSEPVVFKSGFEAPDEEIKRALVEYSLA